MTDDSTATPPSGSGAPPPPINWVSLISEIGTIGQQAAQEFTTNAAKSADDARKGNYDTDRWLQDVELFWDGLAKYSKAGIEAYRHQLPTPNP
jgi:hypothetical protein